MPFSYSYCTNFSGLSVRHTARIDTQQRGDSSPSDASPRPLQADHHCGNYKLPIIERLHGKGLSEKPFLYCSGFQSRLRHRFGNRRTNPFVEGLGNDIFFIQLIV